MAQAAADRNRYAPMKFFNREKASKRADRVHNENVSERMRVVLSRELELQDAEKVETRLRNLHYGSSRQ